MNCSSLARSEFEGHKEVPRNGTSNTTANANSRTEEGNQYGPVSNGIAKSVVPPAAKTYQMVIPAVETNNNDLLPKVPILPQNGDSKHKTAT